MPRQRTQGFAIEQLYPYDPRLNPLPAPSVGIFDEPTVAICINSQWASHIDGVLERLRQADAWLGDEAEQYRAIQEIEKLLVALAIGSECMPFDPCCPEELDLLSKLLAAQRKTNQLLSDQKKQVDSQAAFNLALLDDGDARSLNPEAGETWDTKTNGEFNNLCAAVDDYVRTLVQMETDSLNIKQLVLNLAALSTLILPPAALFIGGVLGATSLALDAWESIINDPEAIEEVVCAMVENLQGQPVNKATFAASLNASNVPTTNNSNAAALATWVDENNQADENYRAFLAHLGSSDGQCPCGCEGNTLALADDMEEYAGASVTYRGKQTVNLDGEDYEVKVWRLRLGLKTLTNGKVEFAAGLRTTNENECCPIISVGSSGQDGLIFVEVLGNTVTFCDGTEAFAPAGGAIEGCVRQVISKAAVTDSAGTRAILAARYEDFTFDPRPEANCP